MVLLELRAALPVAESGCRVKAAQRLQELRLLQARLRFVADLDNQPNAATGSVYLYTLACAYLAAEEGTHDENVLEELFTSYAEDEGVDGDEILNTLCSLVAPPDERTPASEALS